MTARAENDTEQLKSSVHMPQSVSIMPVYLLSECTCCWLKTFAHTWLMTDLRC